MQENNRDFSILKNRIVKFLENKGISKYEFYQKTGISNGILSQKNGLSEENLMRFLNYFGEISLDWLIYGKEPMLRDEPPTAHPVTMPGTGVPLIPIDAVAGLPLDGNIGIRFTDCALYTIPEFNNLGVEYMIRASDSSMCPKYSNGDILACRRVHDLLFFQWGKIYVIDSSQGALVKRVFQDKDAEHILLVSENKDHYPPFSMPKSDIRSVSIVLGVVHLE